MAAPLTIAQAEKILQEQRKLSAELAESRVKASWLRRQLERLMEENHLSEKVRHALEGK